MSTINETILDSLPDPIILIDRDRNVVRANLAAQTVLECKAPGEQITNSIRHPAVLDAIDRVLGGQDRYVVEVSFPVPIARTLELHVTSVPPDSTDETETQRAVAVLVFHDMTAAVRAEKMRVDFVTNASHELRSPLTAILGFIETMIGPASDDTEARIRFLDIMRREAERMRRLIDDLLSLSRVEADEHVRPTTSVDIAGVLRSALDVLESRAKAQNMAIELDIRGDLPKIIGDPDQLIQVFRNLIENAIIHGNEGTSVQIDIAPETRLPDSSLGGVVVHVRDHGKGVPNEMIPRLTERFFRGDRARSGGNGVNPRSTGLGLAIVKHIVNRHRGRMRIESELGVGSVFSIYLPAQSPQAIVTKP